MDYELAQVVGLNMIKKDSTATKTIKIYAMMINWHLKQVFLISRQNEFCFLNSMRYIFV